MKIQKHVSRKKGKKVYYKWVLVIPANYIEQLEWIEGQEIEATIKEGRLILNTKR